MDITITIKPEREERILNAFDYTPEMGGKKAFLKQELHNIIKSKVVMSELAKREAIVQPEIDITNLDLS